MIPQVTPKALAAWRADAARAAPLLVDVREPWETRICRIEGSQLTPMAALPGAVASLPRDQDIVLVCHHGGRSMHAGMWLRAQGFERVHNLQGGVAAWADDVEPAMPRY